VSANVSLFFFEFLEVNSISVAESYTMTYPSILSTLT